jgi:hypothetical protein
MNDTTTSDSKNRLDEFLNPKSMLTPGVCGAVIMTITNALGVSFGIVGVGRTFICLGLSFLVGSLVFVAGPKSSWPKKAIFYVLNSLIIFSMAAGTNSATQISQAASPPGANAVPASLMQTQVVARVVTNLHSVPNLGHIRLVTTNYSTNIMVRAAPQAKMLRPQFFQQWH